LKTKDKGLATTDTLNENCFWELNLYTGQLYWSNEICKFLGISKPYTLTLEQLMQYYQPEQNIRAAFNRAIHQGIPFELDLPAVTASNKAVVVCTIGSPVYDDYGKCIAIKGTLQTSLRLEIIPKAPASPAEKTEGQQMMLDNFARVVSHNLRSHTSNLQMVLESIHQKTSPKEMRDLIGDIKVISSNLSQTVGYLNTLIKI